MKKEEDTVKTAALYIRVSTDKQEELSPDSQWLGDTDHIHMAFIPQHGLIDDAFFLIAGEPGKLPQQDHIKGMLVRLGGSDHLLELWPLIRLPAGNTIFRVDVLVGHDHIVAFGIV